MANNIDIDKTPKQLFAAIGHQIQGLRFLTTVYSNATHAIKPVAQQQLTGRQRHILGELINVAIEAESIFEQL